MDQETCPQCAGTLSNGPSRLVQDACGHKKCRLCLVNDEDFCKQCSGVSDQSEKLENHIDCHTAVITYQKKLDDKINNEKVVQNNVLHKVKQEIVDTNEPSVPQKERETNIAIKSDSKNANNKKCNGLLSPSNKSISFDPKTQLYTCNYCTKSFSVKSRIKSHKYCNGDKRPFVCDTCNQGFISKSHYTVHILSHSKSKPYKCTTPGCGKTFSERSKLTRHRSTHGTNRPFVCQECGKSFKIKENLRTHSLIHKQEKPYACTECDLRFSHSSNLKKHLAVHSSDKTHMCDQCGKCYKLKWELTLHRRVHLKTRPYKCSTCHKTFVHLKDLARHDLIHKESKGYRCGICSSTFRRKDNLNRHARNTHPGKKPQIIKCVDTPNAIKVITSPITTSVTTSSENDVTSKDLIQNPSTEIQTKVNAAEFPKNIKNEIIKDVGVVKNGVKKQDQELSHVPVKLAFKTLSFRSHYKINNDYLEPKPENVSIYEKILKPRSETRKLETSAITHPVNTSGKDLSLKETTKQNAIHAEPLCSPCLMPFNAPSHYETSFDNKKHAVIKNIKFKLPDNYTNLNTSKERDKLIPENNATTSVIVNSTGTHQQTV